MLDIRLIREKSDFVKQRLAARGENVSTVDDALEIDVQRRKIITEVEQLKSERNSISKEIGIRKKNKESADDLMQGMKQKSERIAQFDEEVRQLEEKQQGILLCIPNLPHEACPVGKDEKDNPEVHTFGKKPELNFEPKSHMELVADLGMIDFSAAATLSGSGFLVFKAAGARLERALISYLLDKHADKNGYTEISPPFIVRGACMQGTGQLPKFREDAYCIESEELFLTPTAEVPVTNLHRESILSAEDLPKKYVAYTPCFRKEAGSAGKETRGMTRVHQFDKVELVKIVDQDSSFNELESLLRHAEEILEELGLHYRTIELCTGDLGFGAAKCYDVEVWAPGAQSYLEVSSCSNFLDFQSRRMNLRYKDKDGKNKFCHTLNGSGTALPRLFIALIETYQQKDGRIKLPEPLHDYFGAKEIS
ncbi:MAG: serine--tRNA ligase [Verrucomicrobiota bacterium]